ncbi:phage holin family protein [Ferrovum myxofaciens]|jgi:putative membrane protein|uniref:Phage holin family protein n=1 Tax=Ferrovum myxofaciens TaxID=416213 RepID=A0A8F3DXR9_9PROT|nr:phage holin family protein [Ferrovum myxofaciens]MBW8028665.1 phage holin family protein [Ferrovum sp.]KXW59021.1 membrane protein of unknown function [Ferrovum myxofaciens]MBU6995828.1 phage holin family protein [Ferrovum myxofaciens]NDU88988.1 phage holin family protein [Ferrovum sp.]QKE39389.1 MAG: phage holin family protein [Ferrovum myxofaciens]
MSPNILNFLLQWGTTTFSLWVCSYVFKGIRFDSLGALVISALVLGFANAVVKPILILLTLPLTLFTFGFFLLVINALMILLVSYLVRGFTVSGFWEAFFASIFVSLLSLIIGAFLSNGSPPWQPPPGGGNWV